MEAQQVVEKILSEAQTKADEIKAQAREKQDRQQGDMQQQLDEFKKTTEEMVQQAAADEREHRLASARMDIAKDYLGQKRDILDKVFDKARQQILSMPDDQYRGLMEKLMLGAVQTGEEEVIVDQNEKRLDANFINTVSGKLKDGLKKELKLSEQRGSIEGGFILKRGQIKTNCSIDMLLSQARNDLEIELAKELFTE